MKTGSPNTAWATVTLEACASKYHTHSMRSTPSVLLYNHRFLVLARCHNPSSSFKTLSTMNCQDETSLNSCRVWRLWACWKVAILKASDWDLKRNWGMDIVRGSHSNLDPCNRNSPKCELLLMASIDFMPFICHILSPSDSLRFSQHIRKSFRLRGRAPKEIRITRKKWPVRPLSFFLLMAPAVLLPSFGLQDHLGTIQRSQINC